MGEHESPDEENFCLDCSGSLFAIAVLFLVANRQLVAVSLDPFRADNPAVTTPELPLWFWLMTMMFIGFAIGAAGMWLSARPGRQKARLERRELKALRKDYAALEQKLSETAPPAEEDLRFWNRALCDPDVMSPHSVKICGVTDIDTALTAARAGADYLGFVFFRKSPRFIAADAAEEIIMELKQSSFDEGFELPKAGRALC